MLLFLLTTAGEVLWSLTLDEGKNQLGGLLGANLRRRGLPLPPEPRRKLAHFLRKAALALLSWADQLDPDPLAPSRTGAIRRF